MSRVLGWINVVAGFFLLVLILSGIFSRLLTSIAEWNSFNTLAAKIVVSIAGLLAIFSSAYLVIDRARENRHRS